jgi:hypothetical protein
VLINTQPYKSKIFLAQNKHAWACQSGTMVDPSKIEAFRPFLLEGEPIFEEGVVKTFEHKEYCIVHQYDRVPEWKKFVQQKYEQEDESQLFVYRTT